MPISFATDSDCDTEPFEGTRVVFFELATSGIPFALEPFPAIVLATGVVCDTEPSEALTAVVEELSTGTSTVDGSTAGIANLL